MMAETRQFFRANSHWTSVYTLLQENPGGEAETVVLTGGADGVVEEDDVDGETPLQWKKVLQNWLPSCARGPGTLCTTWPTMRSMEEGAHRQSVDVGNGIRCRGQKGEAQAAKPSGKYREPLAKLRAQGINERVAGALANQRRVAVARKQSRAGHDGEEAKWSGKRRKEALATRRSGVGDKTTSIRERWPTMMYDHCRITAHGVTDAHE
jgi:hypothetical protein